MNEDLVNKLYNKYGDMLTGAGTMEPISMFGIEVSDGWYQLLDCLLSQIKHYQAWRARDQEDYMPIRVTQIKEKYGSLRFYYDNGDERIYGMVSVAEAMSGYICETCGAPAKLRGGYWLYTACDAHTREEDLMSKHREDTYGPE